MNDDIAEYIFKAALNRGNVNTMNATQDEKKCAIALKSQGYFHNPHINMDIFELTKLGEEVLQSGGWKEYKDSKRKQKEKTEKKDHYELQMSKLRYYTFWPVLFLGSIGGVYSIIQITKSLTEEKKEKIEKVKELSKEKSLLKK